MCQGIDFDIFAISQIHFGGYRTPGSGTLCRRSWSTDESYSLFTTSSLTFGFW